MSVPLQSQLFDAFFGTHEKITSTILSDIFSTGGSKNVWMDKYARVRRIGGYVKQNASAYVTNIGGATARVRAVYQYRATTGGSTVRQLIFIIDSAGTEWEIWKSTDDGVTGTFLYDAGGASIASIPDFAQFADNLYITNGVMAPRKYDGTTITAAGRTQSPTPTITSLPPPSSTGDPGFSGHYRWKIVSMVGDTHQAASISTASTAVYLQHAVVEWTIDPNGAVTGYEIYRTTGTGEVFYNVGYVAGRATLLFTDDFPDSFILENRVLVESGDVPLPGMHFVEAHKQRLWWGRVSTTFPTRVYWSDPGLPEDIGTFNYLDFSDSSTVGDVITGMVGDFDGRLIVLTEKAIWAVSGTGQVIGDITDWTRTKTDCQIGAVTHRAAARIPAGSTYSDQEGRKHQTSTVTLAYLTPIGDIRLFDGENDTIISHPVATTVGGLIYAQRAKSYCVVDPVRGEVSWGFATGVQTEPLTTITWNYKWGVWYARDWQFDHIVESDSATVGSQLIAADPSAGFIYQLWNGNSNAGTAINAVWMSKPLFGINDQGEPETELAKRWRWADFLFTADASMNLLIEWLPGSATDSATATGSKTVALTTTPYIPTIVLFKDVGGINLTNTGIRLRVSDNTTVGAWIMESFKLIYQSLHGLDRRMP